MQKLYYLLSTVMAVSHIIFFVLLAAPALARPSQSRFMWMPDGDGNLHLVDLLEEEIEPAAFNGEKHVILNLYTQNNPKTPERIKLNDFPSSFDASKPTRFIIHGWNSAAKHMDHIREAYISTGDAYNVILVDWSSKANSMYSSAKSSALKVGKYIAEVIENLESLKGVNLDDVSIIGHSLGAHAAGVAGHNLNSRVGMVVGLDPAAPLFGTASLANRLDASDAQFVVAIHTNGGLLGWNDPLAHSDFFPNGGSSQSGCGLDLAGSCSHSRSHQYFAESIISQSFVGTQCNSYKAFSKGTCSGNPTAVMGEWSHPRVTGSFYLATNKKSPYAQG